MSLPVTGVLSREIEPLSPPEREPAPPLPQGSLNAEPVPAAQRPGPVPLLRILMPVVMVAAMVAMVALLMLGGSGANPMMLLFPLMMGMSLLMVFSPQQGEDADETRRAYLRHLGALRDKALRNAERQRAHEFHRHPEPGELWSYLDSRRLWERGPEDADTLEVRIGLGDTTLCTPVQVPDSGAAEDLDPVCAVSLRRTVQAVGTCPGMPVAVQLQAFRYLGLAGPRAGDLARALVAQLVFAHGPETVSVETVGQGWDWLKWLPHSHHPEQARHRILIVDHTTTTGTEPYIDDPTWTTIIDVGSRATTALGMRAEQEGLALSADRDGILRAHTAAGVEDLGVADGLREDEALLLARSLTRFRRPAGAAAEGGRDLMSLIGVADIEALTPETMWPGRELSRQRLVVPIGTTEQGVPVRLDLKESAHGGMGPHGLCIGATGSGKSELLRTLVVSLAATHSPDELNLVLVDFKGGATFLGCERLPHTSAVITNLADEAVLVERMFDAISGELNRRQEVLREAGNFANVTEYTTARLGGRDLPPLPALVIVVDEFSELLAAHPDFADLFVAVGRLGRSLHVHLLLASQRLEEGRLRGLDSHLSYRIGLKTFSAAESRQVLGVPDAHHLPARPGAGFLRHDADLTRFQAAYVSGPLERRDVTALPDGSGRVALFTGWEQFAEVEAPRVVDESTTLLDAVVDRARATAQARGQRAHRVWLDPLPAVVELAGVAEDIGLLKAVVGIVDMPYHQRQDPLVVDLATSGGHAAVCGGPQSGKSTALRTIVASLAATHSTALLRFYVLDLGGDQLATLGRLPHVAGVAGRSDPERVRRIVDEVSGFIDHPEDRHTFLVVDGWHTVAADFEDLIEPLTALAADGPSHRVHLIVSAPRWTVLRPAVRDLIAHRIELKLGEAMDSLIDRKAQQKLPGLPGRGLDPEGRPMLLALSSNQDIAHIVSTGGEDPVPRLRVLPPRVHLAELDPAPGVPLAVGGPRLTTVSWDPVTSPHLLVIGGQGSGKSTTLATVMAGICAFGRQAARLVLIDHRRAHLGRIDPQMLAAYSATTTSTTAALRDVLATLSARLPGPDITPAQLAARDWWEGPDIYLVVDDVDLVADHELARLIELLPHSRDIGLHLVLARKSGGIGRALFSPFLSAIRDQTPAVLLLDADRDEGAVFGIRPIAQPPGRGTWQVRGETIGVCQIAETQEES
ncbi:type VII secretion protein EccCa [Corynebacterium sp.]|uniref:type VII secretion protein EccCa n=1 Tax=Corynebacterium sp. TaxID=1720 RepID=UPI0026DFF332|nr:type VII secretion protein EccCa [Corynebacterium sp.]MDO5512751.1 type VII secretion protein EccCa [Corynebacterium sp.]